eukprot:TRINITY_DN6583_c0_g1_i3.p1 TRINITY_DN6583_c0_g1~~TRINITY_DN6583_c0_g1_i3.p1  ORF type:complete len:685 (+),score=152.52 TRINITY_DN6583_c0_g1_i3:51-2105(+)
METGQGSNRLTVLRNQMKASKLMFEAPPRNNLDVMRNKSTINQNMLRDALFGGYVSLRERLFKFIINDPELRHWTLSDSNRKEQRYQTSMAIKKIIRELNLSLDDYKKDPAFPIVLTDVLTAFDQGVSVKLGVHLILYLKTLTNMGSARHQLFVQSALNFEDLGCFALTELGHGSNVRGIQTTATYDRKSREFIINTPNDEAMKFWIGGAAQTANMAAVWAQLYIDNKCYGVHAFVVPLRNKRDCTVLPGITIGDCGPKAGLNGIDNGFIIFRDFRIPRENLLNKFSSVSEDGEFSSEIKNPDKRFGMSLLSLSTGRLAVSQGTLTGLRTGLTIGLRYAAVRRQFGPPDSKEEQVILDYPLTQYRILPLLAKYFALAFAQNSIVDLWVENQDLIYDKKSQLLPEIHALLSIHKAQVAWVVVGGLVELRPVCGGLGYSTFSRFGSLIADGDVNQTYEGDNAVLVQQTAKYLLDKYRLVSQKTPIDSETLSYLLPEADLLALKAPDDLSPRALIKILEFRSNLLIILMNRELANAVAKHQGNLYDAWQAVQPYFSRETATAYHNVYVANQFLRTVEAFSDRQTKIVLTKLFELWALTSIREDLGVFAEVGYLSGRTIEAIRTRIVSLCGELKDEAIGIIEAVADPEEILSSPLATENGDIYGKFLQMVRTFPGTFERPAWWRELRS